MFNALSSVKVISRRKAIPEITSTSRIHCSWFTPLYAGLHWAEIEAEGTGEAKLRKTDPNAQRLKRTPILIGQHKLRKTAPNTQKVKQRTLILIGEHKILKGKPKDIKC